MRLCFAPATLAIIIQAAVAQADAVAASPEFCVVDVENGQATEADLGAAYRMVFWTEVIPNLGEIYIQPLNRGGRWTVDREGRFREFDGIFPTRAIQRHWVADRDGRIIGANDTDMFVIEPSDDAFRYLLALGDFDAGRAWHLSYLPQSDTVFLDTSRDLFELDGLTLVRSRFAVEASEQGFGPIYAPHYIPSIDAHLIESRSGLFVLRHADGTWRSLHRLACAGSCRSYQPEIFDIPGENLIVVKTAKEVFAVDVYDARSPRVTAVYRSPAKIWRNGVRLSEETGAFLIYDPTVFQQLAGDPATPLVNPDDSWLLRLTREGFSPISGAVAVPRSSTIAGEAHYFAGVTVDLPGRGQVLVIARDSLVLFDGDITRNVPDSGPERLGYAHRPLFSRALDRLLIPSTEGLFELTEGGRLVKLVPPFDAGGYPRLHLIDAPHIDAVIFLTRNGVFALDRAGIFHAVPGDHSFLLHNSVGTIGVLPDTNDIMFHSRETLHLLRSHSCAR